MDISTHRLENCRFDHALRIVLLVCSAALCLFLGWCYVTRPDACAAVTVFPPWIWLLPGLLFLGLGWRRREMRPALAVLALWGIFILLAMDELHGVHFSRQSVPEKGIALRVVSLNCGGGNPGAAAEVIRHHPDIVLLQESPGAPAVAALARRLYGRDAGVIAGVDASIIARGRLKPVSLPSSLRQYFVQGRLHLADGAEVEVVAFRLLPPLVRTDLWSPACWRDQTENRRYRREQLKAMVRYLNTVPASIPMIVGGDCNAPAGDAVFRLFRPRLHDSFVKAGRGWGDTHMSDLPILRIDQIWLSDHCRATSVSAHRSRYSDHRMVVCDLLLCSDR